jgi:flavin-dependent dehydrogenase
VQVGDVDRSGEVVERAGVHVARLERHDRGSVVVGERGGQSLDVDAPLLVGTDGARSAEARDAPAEHDGGVHGAPRQEEDLRPALDAGARIVSVVAQHRVAGDDQRGEIRTGRPGHEADPAVAGQSEQPEQPMRRDLLDGGGGGRGLA